MKKTIGLGLLLVVVAMATVLVVRTLGHTSKQGDPETHVDIALDEAAAAERLAGALTYRTVSHQDPAHVDTAAFLGLHRYLERTYPLVHSELRPETVADLSLLYTWPGEDISADPVVLMAHLDVVPVDSATAADWTHPPYEGVIAEGYVWGRGSLDDKIGVLAALEAVELLLSEGYRPARTVYLAFGHDEEILGPAGARGIARLLASRGVDRYALVLDEGGYIVDGLIPGVGGLAAIIGVAEKGYVSVNLTVEGEGGHSSMPPPQTSIGILSEAITELEKHQFPTRLDGAALRMFEYVGPEMPFFQRMLFANLWLFRPLVLRGLASTPTTAAAVRTTTAATVFHGGVKDNVLPQSASAVVNFRILPGETVETVVERVRRVIDDERVELTVLEGHDPSAVSDTDSPSFRLLERTLRQVMPGEEIVVAPYLTMAGTDARHYALRSSSVFRFQPLVLADDDLERPHGTDERVSITNYATVIEYLYQLIRNLETL